MIHSIIPAAAGTTVTVRTPVPGDKGGAYKSEQLLVVAWAFDPDDETLTPMPVGVNGLIRGASTVAWGR